MNEFFFKLKFIKFMMIKQHKFSIPATKPTKSPKILKPRDFNSWNHHIEYIVSQQNPVNSQTHFSINNQF